MKNLPILSRDFLEEQRSQGITDDTIADFIAAKHPKFSEQLQFVRRDSKGNPDAVKGLLNWRIYGDANYAPPQAEPQDESSLMGAARTVSRYVNAPGDAFTGLALKGIGKVTGLDVSRSPEVQNLTQNVRDTGDLARYGIPAVAGLATAGASIPLSAGISTASGVAGRGIKEATDAATGVDEQSFSGRAGDAIVEGGLVGATDAAFGLAGKGVAKAAQYAAGKLPSRLVNSFIKPANNEFKFGKNPGQAIVDEGIIASSVDDLAEKVATRTDEIGQEIAATIERASRGGADAPQIDMTPIISKPIDEAIAKASKLKRTNATTIAQLNSLKEDLLEQYGNVQTPLGAWEAKRQVGSLVNWTKGDPFDELKNKTLWQVFEGLKDVLNKNVDGLEPLNSRYSELLGAKTSIARRMINIERSNLASLPSILTGTATAGADFTASGDPMQALTRGVAAGAITKAAGSTLAKTAGAQALKVIPQAVLSSVSTLQTPAKLALIELLLAETSESSPSN